MKVISANGDVVVVPTQMLDDLIRRNQIVAFLRSDGWAVMGCDPMRKVQLPLIKAGDRWSDYMISRTVH